MTLAELTENDPEVYDISNDPLSNIVRKVWYKGLQFDKQAKFVNMYTLVIPVTAENEVINTRLIKPNERTMKADNSRKVNPVNGMLCVNTNTDFGENGEQIGDPVWVDLEGNTIANPVGQYDFFRALMLQPVNIPQAVGQAVLMGDTEKAFD